MRFISFLCCFAFVPMFAGCRAPEPESADPATSEPTVVIAERFAYPLGTTGTLTQAKDSKDSWYNAQDFGTNDHLGEDWNTNAGGNSDCGETVYAAGAGSIVFAEYAGAGWGNVVIIEHTLKNGVRVRSLYGHLQRISKASGIVGLREAVGEVGNDDGRYLCHLHFEIRTDDCPMWNEAGPGYSSERKGWIDPSDFIDQNR